MITSDLCSTGKGYPTSKPFIADLNKKEDKVASESFEQTIESIPKSL